MSVTAKTKTMMLNIMMSWFYCWERKLEPTFKGVVKYSSAENVYKYLRRWHEGPAEVATPSPEPGVFWPWHLGVVCRGRRERELVINPPNSPAHGVAVLSRLLISTGGEKQNSSEYNLYLVFGPGSVTKAPLAAGGDWSVWFCADDDGIQRITFAFVKYYISLSQENNLV